MKIKKNLIFESNVKTGLLKDHDQNKEKVISTTELMSTTIEFNITLGEISQTNSSNSTVF